MVQQTGSTKANCTRQSDHWPQGVGGEEAGAEEQRTKAEERRHGYAATGAKIFDFVVLCARSCEVSSSVGGRLSGTKLFKNQIAVLQGFW